MLVRKAKLWRVAEREVTPEQVYLERRRFLKGVAAAGLGIGTSLASGGRLLAQATRPASPQGIADLFPARRNAKYELDRPLTDEQTAARFNVFDEFSVDHEKVWSLVEGFEVRPWTVQIGGTVKKPLTFDVDELVRRIGIEERLYRHRCVETWAMAVPWSGFPFKRLIDLAEPSSKANYVRMVSFSRPEQAPGWYATRRVFPYYEALSLEEATNDLAFLAVGIYGHPLPAQHGAPLRLVVPWKYGLKSIKSIVAFQFTQARPGTFWNELSPDYYSFECNVDPDNFPGPWSQEEERMLGTGEIRKTRLFNGYAEEVAHLYPGAGQRVRP